MAYSVKLSIEELAALGALIGQPIDQVTTNGWSAELHSGELRQAVIPAEVSTPDSDHPHGVVERPMLSLDGQSLVAGSSSVLAKNLGTLRAINAISTLVAFTPVVDCPAVEILPGVVLPPSRGYGMKFFAPNELAQAQRIVGCEALVDLDIAFELVCDLAPSVVIYTRGYFVHVSVLGLPTDEEWVASNAYVRRPVRPGFKAEPADAMDSR